MRIIEPFGAGGGPDLVARAISAKLSELWGQPVTVENHPGAGSTAAPAVVTESPADGYTLLVNTSAHPYSAALLKNLPYDPLKDFIPVASLNSQPYVLLEATLLELLEHDDVRARVEALKIGMAYLWGKPRESVEHRAAEGAPAVEFKVILSGKEEPIG